MKYKDLFIDFDDTLYDTYGNSVIALRETFEAYGLARYFANPQIFYDAYWQTNIDLWTQYSKGEIVFWISVLRSLVWWMALTS